MLEFIIILPMFLFLIVFMVDMGRVIMVATAVQEATYRSARASAIAGGADLLVTDSQGGLGSVSDAAFFQALEETPGGRSAENISLSTVSGGRCEQSEPNNFVTIQATYDVKFLTPGMGGLLRLAGGGTTELGTSYSLQAVSVSRCEVVGVQSGVLD